MIYVLQISYGKRAIDGWQTIGECADEATAYACAVTNSAPFKRIVKYDPHTDTIRETVYEYGKVMINQ